MVRAGARRGDAPEIEISTACLGRAADGSPPRDVVAHQHGVSAAATSEKAVSTPAVAGDQHSCQRLLGGRMLRDVSAAPGEQLEQQTVVALVREVDAFPSLNCSGLASQLSCVVTFLDDHT